MSKASDELREFVEENDLYASQIAKLNTIADRIDAEMVELPRDANDEPTHLGDKTYDFNGDEQTAISFQLYGEEDPTWMVNCPDGHVAPYNLTHRRPDILELIADELDDFKLGRSLDLSSIAERIRKLAKED